MRADGFVRLLFLVLLVAAFAGCAKAKAAPPPDPFAQPQGFDDFTGSVEGVVVDEEFQPLKDAIVGFIDPYQATKTDEAGHFEIGLLDPVAQRNLYVIHLGHKSAGKRIMIETQQATWVQFILPVLPIEEPWVDLVQRRGEFRQAVSLEPGTTAINRTGHGWILRDHAGALEAVHVQVEWRDNSGLSSGMRVTFGLGSNATRDLFFTLDGRSPLVGTADRAAIEDVFQKSKTVCVRYPCHLRWDAEPAAHTTNLPVDFGVMVEQPFDVYVSHFFRHPMPDGYMVYL